MEKYIDIVLDWMGILQDNTVPEVHRILKPQEKSF